MDRASPDATVSEGQSGYTPDRADAGAAPGTATQPELPEQAQPAANPAQPAAAAEEPGARALDNDKHERFCEHVTGWGGTGDPVAACDAYAAVYGTRAASARVNASRLAARKDVRERCAWMRGQLAASVLLNKASVRSMLFRERVEILNKTKGTKHKEITLAVMRDIEKSLGLDVPEVSRNTVSEETTGQRALAVEQIGKNVEQIAAAMAGRRVTVLTTVNE